MAWTHVTTSFVERFVAAVALNPVDVITTRVRNMKAEFKSLAATIMGAFFSLTTLLRIVIGILLTNTYKEDSSTGLIVEGVLNSASAGILIHDSMGLPMRLHEFDIYFSNSRLTDWIRLCDCVG